MPGLFIQTADEQGQRCRHPIHCVCRSHQFYRWNLPSLTCQSHIVQMWLNCFQSQPTPQLHSCWFQRPTSTACRGWFARLVCGHSWGLQVTPWPVHYSLATGVLRFYMQPEGIQLGLGTLWGMTHFCSWEVEHYLPQTFGNGMMTAGIQKSHRRYIQTFRSEEYKNRTF